MIRYGGLWEAGKIENSSLWFVRGIRREANLEMSLPFSKSLAISTLSNHTRLIRSNFSSLSISISQYWMFYIFEIPFFPLFWGEKDRLDPTRFRVIAPLLESWDTSRKVNHLESPTTFKFYNTLRESIYLVEYTLVPPSPKNSRENLHSGQGRNAEDFKILNRRCSKQEPPRAELRTKDSKRSM